MKHASRRQFVCNSCGVLAAWKAVGLPYDEARRGSGDQTSQVSQLTLRQQFRDARLRAISGDAAKICLYFTKDGQESLRWNGQGWRLLDHTRKDSGAVVMEVGSWREVQRVQLRRSPLASFFSDSRRLYLETDWYEERKIQRMILDCVTGEVQERVEARAHATVALTAVKGNTLVGNEFKGRSVALLHVVVPEWTTMKRVLYSPIVPEEQRGIEVRGPVFSANRAFFAHPYGQNTLVYRRTEDLGVAWSKALKPEVPVWAIGVSATGHGVAVALTNQWDPSHGVIVVLDGHNGSEISRIAVDGSEGVALSPDLRYLAVGQRVLLDQSTGETEMKVKVYSLRSGDLFQTLLHDRLRIRRGRWADGSFLIDGIQFTPDGKYLITSGRHTKIWAIKQ